MPRIYKKKTNRGSPTDVLERAMEYMEQSNISARTAARHFNVHRTTLQRFINKRRVDPQATFGYINCKLKNLVFTPQMERELALHVKELALQFHGLSKEKVLQLAYKFAVANNIDVPPSWIQNEKTGHFWLSFKERNKLTLRSPEATSQARASAFNRHTVKEFYTNLASVMDRFKFTPNDIFNLDETGVHTVQVPGNVVTELGVKQVGSVTSAERGELVTLVYSISASGSVIAPMFIFPRVNYRDHFIKGALNGSIGKARSGGWINEELFVEYLDHLITSTRCNKEKRILLIMDNHESHISLPAVDVAKENGIVILTIPPHTSHKLQPLDRTCFGPFKTAYSKAMDNWMRTHPGKTVTIYDIPEIVTEAHALAFTQRNICSGFQCTGIFPFNNNLFTDLDFASSSVTDRPDPGLQEAVKRYDFLENHCVPDNTEQTETENSRTAELTGGQDLESTSEQHTNICEQLSSASENQCHPHPLDSPQQLQLPPSPSPCTSAGLQVPSGTDRSYISPQDILALPRAEPRKNVSRNTRRRFSRVVTDTPNRNEIAARRALKTAANKKSSVRAKRSIFKATQDSSDSEDLDIFDFCFNTQSDDEFLEN